VSGTRIGDGDKRHDLSPDGRKTDGVHAVSPQLALAMTIGFSRKLLESYDAGELDAVIVRQEGSRRGGEKLTEDEFGWFASPLFRWRAGESLPLATLAAPCGVRALAARALDKAGIEWNEAFVGGGVTAVAAAALAGLAVAPLARRIAPSGLIDIGITQGWPRLGSSKVMLHSKVSEPAKLAALRTLAATFRSVVAAG
jgi:DNA-binding transcriptional LysR family regulator